MLDYSSSYTPINVKLVQCGAPPALHTDLALAWLQQLPLPAVEFLCV